MDEKLNIEPNAFDIVVRDEGIYMCAGPTSNVFRLELNMLIEMLNEYYCVFDLDESAVDTFLKTKAPDIRISSSTILPPTDEKLFVEFENNDMIALIRFTPPVNGGNRFVDNDIYDALKESGIKFGIDNSILDELKERREYFKSYEVAFGRPSINGIDGRLEFLFDTKKRVSKPKEDSNGNVDFMNLDLIQKTSTGRELVKVIQPTQGINGIDVKGSVMYAKPGKLPAKLPRGKNVTASDDELALYSEIDGQIQFDNNKVSVLPVLEINSDVDLSTGNIDFNGAVSIKGGVRENFIVKARGIIEIKGTVEGATIQSDSDVFLNSGVMGADKAKIIVQGNLVAKFIDSAKVQVGGNIQADSIMHSNVECNGEIVLEGKNGLLIGGTTWAIDKIVANEVGSPMATRTIINIGKTPSIGESSSILFKQMDDIKFKIQKLEKIMDNLKALGSSISPDQKVLLLKSNHTKILLATEQRKLAKEIDDINGKISAKRAKFSVRKQIYPGVHLTMGSARKNFDKSLTYATLVSKNGNIEEVPFSE